MKAITCRRLIDGVSNDPIDDGVVLIEEDTVTKVGHREEVDIPASAEVIDYSDNVVIPGLVDAHVHLHGVNSHNPQTRMTEDATVGTARATNDLRKLIQAGFTTVRDAGSKTGLGLRTVVEEGTIPGPRIYTAGLRFSQTAGHGDIHSLPYDWVTSGYAPIYSVLTDGADECRKEARKQIRRGVDLLKIMTTGGLISEKDDPTDVHFTPEEIRVFAEEAHRHDIPLACHAQGAEGAKVALRNGVDTIEHGNHLDDEGIELLVEKDAILVTTLALLDKFAKYGDEHDVPTKAVRKSREARETHIDAITRAYEAGASIAMGTDTTGTPLMEHGKNGYELELLVDAVGMNNMEAIQASTSVAAQTVGDEPIGCLTSGHFADFVVLEEDPLEDITAIYEIAEVYKGGEVAI
ncbi:metal-dependent hydrolase family protein [Natrarchaeobius chitinivorans]|uniref:Amidohydrolase family protein n=1 Tax=Natrarchaeobius chitinivorans TaxID=1679083 RepID=A0A3N6M4J7_NATCH|nr:amidohydrolase family protein [Natrarchaeobius chitinivorans]RQG95414.1 amidohydrolase family protein [Natrarchaeobius chitinivorans]